MVNNQMVTIKSNDFTFEIIEEKTDFAFAFCRRRCRRSSGTSKLVKSRSAARRSENSAETSRGPWRHGDLGG